MGKKVVRFVPFLVSKWRLGDSKGLSIVHFVQSVIIQTLPKRLGMQQEASFRGCREEALTGLQPRLILSKSLLPLAADI